MKLDYPMCPVLKSLQYEIEHLHEGKKLDLLKQHRTNIPDTGGDFVKRTLVAQKATWRSER